MVQRECMIDVLKNDVEGTTTIGEYIDKFNLCDEMMVRTKNRVHPGWSTVSSTRKSSCKEFTCIQLANEQIFICTPTQDVFEVKKNQYKKANTIRKGDILQHTDASELRVDKTYEMNCEEIADVYALVTSDNKPYYINNILVRA